MSAPTIPADVQTALIEHLRDSFANPELAELIGDRVYDKMPGRAAFPLALVREIDVRNLLADASWAETVLVQVDVYGEADTEEARVRLGLIARTVWSSLIAMAGIYGEAVIASARPSRGRQRITEPSGRPRISFDMNVSAHPVPS